MHEKYDFKEETFRTENKSKGTDRVMTTEQAAEFLGLKPATLSVWRSTKAVEIPYYKIGSAVRYRLSDLTNYMENNRQTG